MYLMTNLFKQILVLGDLRIFFVCMSKRSIALNGRSFQSLQGILSIVCFLSVFKVIYLDFVFLLLKLKIVVTILPVLDILKVVFSFSFSVRAVVALNLHSYGSGRNPWGNLKPEYLEKVWDFCFLHNFFSSLYQSSICLTHGKTINVYGLFDSLLKIKIVGSCLANVFTYLSSKVQI